MTHTIHTVTLPMPFGMGTVNSYNIETPMGHILVDTSGSHGRKGLLTELESSGCTRDSLKLIILTHGDFDHIGNAALVQASFGARIAIHPDDSGMAERGDMFVNRKKPNIILKLLMPVFSGFGRSEQFTPDIFLSDGFDLSGYGFDAKVISLPGHSKGSIGILTSEGELFCGDLFENIKGPTLNSLMDDPAAAGISVKYLAGKKITTVYPGHGQPFTMEMLKTNKTRADEGNS